MKTNKDGFPCLRELRYMNELYVTPEVYYDGETWVVADLKSRRTEEREEQYWELRKMPQKFTERMALLHAFGY